MSQNYFIYDEESGKTNSVSKEEYRTFHTEKYNNAQDEDKQQATLDYLSGIRATTNARIPEYLEMNHEAGKGYKDRLNDEERAYHYNDPLTEIGKKKQNALAILQAEKGLHRETDSYIDRYVKGTDIEKNSLHSVSMFFSGNRQTDSELVRTWLGRENDPGAMLENIITEFLKLPLDDLDFSTDRTIAEQAPLLEKMSAQHDIIINLVAQNREAYDNIPDELRERFEEKIGQTNGLVNYYRLIRTVMTNKYYITHENSELSYKKGKDDTLEQKHLFELLNQSNEGLMVLKNLGANNLDKRLTEMMSTLSRTVVKKEQLKLQNELAERKILVDQMGFSNYLRHLEHRGNVDGMKKDSAKNIFDRAENLIVELNLPVNAEDAAGSLIAIMNQLDFVRRLTKEKHHYQNLYYLEQNYRQITIIDTVEKLSAPLRDMKRAILKLSNVSEKGVLKTKQLSKKEIGDLQDKYSAALIDYMDVMDRVNQLRSDRYLELSQDKAMMDSLISHRSFMALSDAQKKNLPVPSKEDEKGLRDRLKKLYLALEENEYSDISIYRNSAAILELNEKCEKILNSDEKNQLRALAELAFDIVVQKRLKDLDAALEQKNIPGDDLALLNNEKGRLQTLHSKGTPETRQRQSEARRKLQLQLRLEAQKMKFDTADMKALAVHYLHQDQWAQNSKRPEQKRNIFTRALRNAASGITRFVGWVFSKTRSSDHGEQLYDRSKQNLDQIPQDLKTFGDENANHFITHGDGTYAPKVELNKYFKDPMKIRIAEDYRIIRDSMNAQTNYPQSIKDAVEALSCYTEVRGVVNNDTIEMEYAFLDKFRNSVNSLLEDLKATSQFPELTIKLMNTLVYLDDKCSGNLRFNMSKEEYQAAKESTAVYTSKTYAGDTEESNVKDMPLFPHSPQLNDIKQGVLGNCYMLGAVQALLLKDPDAIQNMFYDIGDGNVLVRFYAPYGEVNNSYTRIDDISALENATMRPVYVKVRKHYTTGEEGSAFCLWMQLLEKAYAAAGFNRGNPDIDENGELHNLNDELTAGDPAEVLVHLTGNKYFLLDKSAVIVKDTPAQQEIENDRLLNNLQRRMIFKNIPAQLHDDLYNELFKKNKDISGFVTDLKWKESYVKSAVNNVMNENDRIISDLVDRFNQLKSDGKLTEQNVRDLTSNLRLIFPTGEEFAKGYVKDIMKNLNNPSYEDLDEVISSKSCSAIAEQLKEAIKDKDVSFSKLDIIFDDQPVLYEEIPKDEVSEDDIKKIGFSVENILIPNPGERYKQKELGYLGYLRHMIANGHPVAMCSKSGHVMTGLDIKLHNNKWFVLIRDPFNTYRYEYTQKENENADKDSYGFFTAVIKHKSFRNLSPDMKDGFMGCSWWELKDVYKEFDDLAFCRK